MNNRPIYARAPFAKGRSRTGESPDIIRPVLRRAVRARFNAHDRESQKAVSLSDADPNRPVAIILFGLDRSQSRRTFQNHLCVLPFIHRELVSIASICRDPQPMSYEPPPREKMTESLEDCHTSVGQATF
jgi:hypothetical protein